MLLQRSLPEAYSRIHFPGTENFSGTGTYTITAVVQHAGDAATRNDTGVYVIRHLSNAAISLVTPFTDGMETAAIATYTASATGLDNLERYDYEPGTNSRLRTFVNSGVALSGNRALALDADRLLSGPPYPTQYLTGTITLPDTVLPRMTYASNLKASTAVMPPVRKTKFGSGVVMCSLGWKYIRRRRTAARLHRLVSK
jgi:hypothetical protein